MTGYDCGDDVLLARVRAVATARRAIAEDELDALFTLRQSLVDLAAIAESLADELPRPARMRTTLR
jgi:hypothetical protein